MSSVLITGNGTYGFGQVQIQQPGKDHVLIKVEAATLNPSDILFMQGKYNVKLNYPYTPGWEGSGVVVAAGEGSHAQSLVGKRVVFMKSFEVGTYQYGGSFAEYCVTSAF